MSGTWSWGLQTRRAGMPRGRRTSRRAATLQFRRSAGSFPLRAAALRLHARLRHGKTIKAAGKCGSGRCGPLAGRAAPESYSWEAFRGRPPCESWDGVRNYQARNSLRGMHAGDPVLYYESGDSKSVVGTARVSRAAYLDPMRPRSTGVGLGGTRGREGARAPRDAPRRPGAGSPPSPGSSSSATAGFRFPRRSPGRNSGESWRWEARAPGRRPFHGWRRAAIR